MKRFPHVLGLALLGSMLCASTPKAAGQAPVGAETRFFRIAGPAVTTISGIALDGALVWTNAMTGVTCTVQTAASLASPIQWVDYLQVPVTSFITSNRLFDLKAPVGLALIPAGVFTMGNGLDASEGHTNEIPLHTVQVSAFYMDRCEVTKARWDEVFVWATNHGYSFNNAGMGKAPSHPVQRVNWYDCVKWCNARSEKEGRTPAYYTNAALTGIYKAGQALPQVNWSAGYRLPTEAEWEKAARGGLRGQRFPWGDTITHGRANYYSSANFPYDPSPTREYHPAYNDGIYPYTSPVGAFAPNGYGLYDMVGNVWEWCWDWQENYGSTAQMDPRGPASGSYRVLRGGSWYYDAGYCRAAFRLSDYPSNGYAYIGFRCVLPPVQR